MERKWELRYFLALGFEPAAACQIGQVQYRFEKAQTLKTPCLQSLKLFIQIYFIIIN